MRHRHLRLHRAFVAAVIVALASAAPAFAGPTTYTVTAGSAVSGTDVSLSANTSGPTPQAQFFGPNTTISCNSASLDGAVTTGPGQSGAGLIQLDQLSWSGCGGYTITGTADLDATGTTVNGVTPVAFTGMSVHVSSTLCSFDLTGSVDGSYDNTTTTLTFPGTPRQLIASNVTGAGCALIDVNDGDIWGYQADYDLSADNPAYDPIAIN